MSVIYYRPQVLETIARQTLCKYDCGYLNQEPAAVPIEMIIENTFQLTIEYQYLTNNARELGRMIYDSGITTYYDQDLGDYALMRVQAGTMLIDASLLTNELYGRLRFTLAHELAHYIIHKGILNILVWEYRCSGGTDTANPAAGNRCSGTGIPHLIDCYLRVYSLKAGSNPYTSRMDL